ncbi:DUF2309 domain-containing protein [Pseudovibrio exalbescens]|uniref:YbcC family protein n=1 Tax=Pseudovibrio exalbescens TaxID=197461 RepID=UPI0023672E49|nr:DUF2309 domain-containing protein [Pseudovibrio exalbescens]MDD7909267.1 DUF2309 domain-containing protein [Pseudovibrio exalbescens]
MNAPFNLDSAALSSQAPLVAEDALKAATAAAGKIAPLWSLKTFVAVNPFLGLSDQRFDEAAQTMAQVAGARMTMPRAFYMDALDRGRISHGDLAAALDEAQIDGLPRDPELFLALARSEKAQNLTVLPTLTDIAGDIDGMDWSELMLESIARYAAEYFDEGQASWVTVTREKGFYEGWHETASVDRTADVAGLKGFRKAVKAMPKNAEGLIALAAERFGLTKASVDLYFHRLLMTVGGWSSYARQKVWQAELNGGTDATLTDFLAIRLAWELAIWELCADKAGFDSAWKAAVKSYENPREQQAVSIACVFQSAYDKAWQRDFVTKFAVESKKAAPKRMNVQAAFCIDVRSEVFRRALETASQDVETIGFAGFFGFPIEYVPLGQRHGGAQCPVLLKPQFIVCESVGGADAVEEKSILDLRMFRRKAGKAFKSFKLAAVSSFAFVETLGLTYIGKLATDALGLSRPVPHPLVDGFDKDVQDRLTPDVTSGELDGRITGFTETTRVDMAQAVLTAMSLTKNFARIVLLAGHGSTTVNNPHASGLDCGACGGHTGEANARVAAAILNDRKVREGLKARGIEVPEDTIFLGALHDTTTDEVQVYGEESIPATHIAEFVKLKEQLADAAKLARAERAAQLNLEEGKPVDGQILARSTDWAQVRPEWGLAGCAAFVVAPRERTAGLDFGGRSFLHSYEWQQDEGFKVLELIMTAPMIVTSWISLQYYGSTVDNKVFGSGNKVLHNVVGTIGVLEGNGGDLRPGLPMQSIHDGEKLIHEPLRLNVAIEAPIEAMNAIIERHEMVRNLVDNGWLHLFALGENGQVTARYTGNLNWEDADHQVVSQAA